MNSEDFFKVLEEDPKKGVSMSTFSGAKEGGIDMSSFGTMQAGSFSKKKQEDFFSWNWVIEFSSWYDNNWIEK